MTALKGMLTLGVSMLAFVILMKYFENTGRTRMEAGNAASSISLGITGLVASCYVIITFMKLYY